MKMSAQRDRGWRLHEAPFPFQQTFVTPLQNLSLFVPTLLSTFDFQELAIKIETVVFEPDELIAFLAHYGIDKREEPWLDGETFIAENKVEAAKLLEATLADWIDFAAMPSPEETFAIYADHDEYITVFTQSEVLLNTFRESMKKFHFKEVEDWYWDGPKSLGKVE